MEGNYQQTCDFRGKKYLFTGDPTITCKCLSNGHKCNQRGMSPAPDDCFVGAMDRDGFICKLVWKEVIPEIKHDPEDVELWSETDVELLLKQCYSICGFVPYLEEYSHTNAPCWKINNPFTQFQKSVITFGTIDQGLLYSLKLAIRKIHSEKVLWMKGDA